MDRRRLQGGNTMRLLIQKTMLIDRYNLIDADIPNSNEDRYIKQLSGAQVKELGISIIELLPEGKQ